MYEKGSVLKYDRVRDLLWNFIQLVDNWVFPPNVNYGTAHIICLRMSLLEPFGCNIHKNDDNYFQHFLDCFVVFAIHSNPNK